MNETDYRRLTMMTNLYYILLEASDMMLRRAKIILENNKKGLNREVKRRHNLLMQHYKALINLSDSLLEDYECFDGKWENYDQIRKNGAWFARMAALTADRCMNDSPVEKDIEKFIYNLPQQDIVDNKFLEDFIIR